MQILSNLFEIKLSKSTIATIGTFDGIHLGHRKLIEKVLDISESENLRSIVLTFDPHPRVVLNNDNNISLLTTQEEKNSLLESVNLDYLIIQEFSKEELIKWVQAKDL